MGNVNYIWPISPLFYLTILPVHLFSTMYIFFTSGKTWTYFYSTEILSRLSIEVWSIPILKKTDVANFHNFWPCSSGSQVQIWVGYKNNKFKFFNSMHGKQNKSVFCVTATSIILKINTWIKKPSSYTRCHFARWKN